MNREQHSLNFLYAHTHEMRRKHSQMWQITQCGTMKWKRADESERETVTAVWNERERESVAGGEEETHSELAGTAAVDDAAARGRPLVDASAGAPPSWDDPVLLMASFRICRITAVAL